VSDSTRHNPWGFIYKISKEKTINKKFYQIKDNRNHITTDSTGIAKQLIEKLFPKDDKNEDKDYHKYIRKFSQRTDNNEEDIEFTSQEVANVINAQNPSKAPGADGLTAHIIQTVNNIDNNLLTNIYNKCVVKVIPKSGKRDYTDCDSYRPISLLSVYYQFIISFGKNI
jgi:hypothetical protein